MSEVLTELVAKITTDAAGLKSGLSDAENQTEASSKRMQDSLKKVGMAMAASGAAITAALGLMGKAAIDEEINIKRLATTMGNVGVQYDKVKDSLEAVISATQRKTGVADNEQRDILNRLILVTNDYGKALELLPTVLDLAAAGEMDATTAATYLGKAFLELEDGAEEVSVRFGQASLQFKNMEDIQNRVSGAAENLINPLNVLKASIGDVAESIGANLVPLIKDAVDKIVDIAIKVQEWTKENPELASTLTKVALALGIVLTVVGGLILILPTLISGVAAFGVVFHAALGPIGLISLAITGLIVAGIALWRNWDKVTHFFEDAWSNIKQFFLQGIDTILAGLERFMGWIPKLGDKIREVRENFSNMIEAEKISRDARDAERALEEVSEALVETTEIVEQNTDATIEQTEALWDNIEVLKEQKSELEEVTDKLKKMRLEYEYARSDAGKLGVTIKDVTYYLFDHGKTIDDLSKVFNSLGDDADNVNKVMEAFGLTAQQVKGILESQKDSVEKLGDAYITTSEKVSSATKLSFDPSKVATNWPVSGEELAPLVNMWQEVVDLRTAGKWEEANVLLPAVNALQSELYGFKNGGIVPGPIGMPQLAMVHGGETVIPANESMGNVVVNFSQPVFFDREDTMNRFVDMIRKGIQRQDRLRFGGAYAGS